MSTKLYNGIIIDTDKNVFQLSKDIRETCEKVFEELNLEYTSNLLKRVYAEYVSEKIKDDAAILEHGLYIKALEKHKEDAKDEFNRNFLLCDVSIFSPLEDGRMLGYVFANKSEYYDAVLELDGIREFAYWNNTDQPDNVTDDEWDERRTLWNNQLDKGFYIKGDGISVELPNIPLRTFAMVDDKIASSVNSNDTKRHIVSKVGQKIMDKKRLERNDEKIDVHTVISWLQCFMEELHKLSDEELPVGDLQTFTGAELLGDNFSIPEIDVEKISEIVQRAMS